MRDEIRGGGLQERTVILGQEGYRGLLDVKEAARLLGYRETGPDPEMQQELSMCSDKLLMVVRPRYTYMEVPLVRETRKGQETLSAVFGKKELPLPGTSIKEHLFGCHRALCACLTLGAETDLWIERLQQESMLDALLADALANAAVERLRMLLESRAAGDFPEDNLNWLFGIGYGDLPLSLQGQFLDAVRAEEKIGLCCNQKYILNPLKSVTGFIGIGESGQAKGLGKEPILPGCRKGRCENCPMKGSCSYKG